MKTSAIQNSSRGRSHGYSLVELLSGVTALSVFTTVGMTMINRQNDAIEDLELQQHIKSLNAAAQAYEFSGGDLSNAGTPDEVILRLKSRADAEQVDQVAGLAGSMIDLRLKAVAMGATESATDQPRAIWDSSTKRFRYATSGDNGIAGFILSDDAKPEKTIRETRKLSTRYAAVDGWVWDYTDQAANGNAGSEDENNTGNSFSDIPVTETTTNSTLQLLPPEFSFPGGEWNYPDFANFQLELYNPNNPGSSSIFVSVNDSPFELYTGSMRVSPDSEIKAYAKSLDPVSYTDSSIDSEMYAMIPQLFEGLAQGNFTDAQGGHSMQVGFNTEGLTSTFWWGDGAYDSPSSFLSFTGSEFTAYGDGSRFNLGTLDFFNGTIWSGTGADSVDLTLEISFTVPETEEAFIFDLDLENTRNYGVDADADADFVRIATPESQFQTVLDGVTYALGLEFGYEGSDGFATVDEFHVHEGSTATADVYGVFVAVDYEEETP